MRHRRRGPPAIYVANDTTNSGTVPAFDASGAAATGYTTPGGFSAATGVAVDPVSNTLYVADNANTPTLRTFNATTGAETTPAGFANATGLNGPEGLLLAGGDLLVANESGNNILAFNAATGAPDTGFQQPGGLSAPISLAILGSTLFVANLGSETVAAYNLSSSSAPLFTISVSASGEPYGLAVYGNDLFVAISSNKMVGEYNATTGAVINASFVTGLNVPEGLAILGNRLLVASNNDGTVGAYGIPAVASAGNTPTSTDPDFLAGLTYPNFIAVAPEPGTWTLLVLGGAGLLAGWTLKRCRALRARAQSAVNSY